MQKSTKRSVRGSKPKGTSLQLTKGVQTGIPMTMQRTLHGAFEFTLTKDSEALMYLNDAYDPFGTSGSNQCYYYDQLAALYTRAFVGKTRYKITLTSMSAAAGIRLVTVPNLDTTSLAGTPITEMIVRPGATGTFLPVQTINTNVVHSPVVAEGTVVTKDYFEFKDWQDADNLQTNTVDDTNLKTIYLHIVNRSNEAANQVFLIEVWQDVTFFARKTVSVS
jgi:hypothetical protein